MTSPIHYATRHNHIDAIRLLLEHGANVNSLNGGTTPLHIASYNGNTNIISLLLDYDANLTIYNKAGHLAIHVAVENIDVFQQLLDKGADINAMTSNGGSVLAVAIWNNAPILTINLILNKGVDVNNIDNTPCTPLHVASSCNNMEAAKLLLKHGADINLKVQVNNVNITPMDMGLAKNSRGQDVSNMLRAMI
jgi:ankyrin repeat protein